MKSLVCLFCCLQILVVAALSQSRKKTQKFLVCGDTEVIHVDYSLSRDTTPYVIRRWDARKAMELPADYRLNKFKSIDDCKPARRGKQLLISSSSGAVAVLDLRKNKVTFYASVPNAHSIAMLPNKRLVAAASTAKAGNKIILFNIRKPALPLFTDSLYSAHGVVWHPRRRSLYALGYHVLREYKRQPFHNLKLIAEWRIPGEGGHDLQLSPDGKNLFLTEHKGSWMFNLKSEQFWKIEGFPDAHNIKSLGQNHSGQYIYTVPEESWWTYHVRFSNPTRIFAFPGMKVYKARWFP